MERWIITDNIMIKHRNMYKVIRESGAYWLYSIDKPLMKKITEKDFDDIKKQLQKINQLEELKYKYMQDHLNFKPGRNGFIEVAKKFNYDSQMNDAE